MDKILSLSPINLTLLGTVVLQLLCFDYRSWQKRIIFLVSTALIIFGLTSYQNDLAWMLSIATLLGLSERTKGVALIYSAVVLILLTVGNWQQADLTEIMLLASMSAFFLRTKDRNGSSNIVILWSLTLLMAIVSKTQVIDHRYSELPFLALLVIAIMSNCWFRLKRVGGNEVVALFSVSLLARAIIESRLPLLDYTSITILAMVMQLVFIASLMAAILISRTEKSNFEKFVNLISLSLFLPLVPDALIEKSLHFHSVYFLAMISLVLMVPLRKSAHGMSQLLVAVLGVVAWIAVLIPQIQAIQSWQSTLCWMAACSAQLFTLVLFVKHDEKSMNHEKYRERLPQIGFLVIVFGALLTLWYILTYVREI